MAIQLAYYKIYGHGTPTYESAQTRAFFHGRTENVRTYSLASAAFCRAHEDASVPAAAKLTALHKAIDHHTTSMSNASSGRGVDRHLLGLRILANGNGGPTPAIFADPSFAASMRYLLSTSNLTPAQEFFGGFGPMYTEGYGIAYALRPNGVCPFYWCVCGRSLTGELALVLGDDQYDVLKDEYEFDDRGSAYQSSRHSQALLAAGQQALDFCYFVPFLFPFY